MDSLDLQAAADKINWWHDGLDLGNGVITQGRSKVRAWPLPQMGLPERMDGATVLDVGAWDGFFSFECERRGADRVVAVDSFVWDKANAPLTQHSTGRDGFDLAHKALQSRVEPVVCEVLDLDPAALGTFDVVLFLGVLYHMQHPLLALEKAAAMTRQVLIVETHTEQNHIDVPFMRFYPGAELVGDATNWWGPNVACVMAMLKTVGFETVEHVAQWETRGLFHAWKQKP